MTAPMPPKEALITLTCRHRSLGKDEAAILDSWKRVGARNGEQKQTLFRKSVKTCVDAANTQQSSRGDIQDIGDALIHYVMIPETSLLSGKGLTITSREHCALISKRSQEGGRVAKIVKCYKYAVLRRKEVNDVGHLNNLITSAFEQANISDSPKGPTRGRFRAVDDDDYYEEMLVWEKAAQSFQIQHCLLVGQCYIGRYVP
ncbi:heterokaryon incompatibility 6 OR allele [Fusarium circinatum]|uniref:Heterokaryon incompatibility 6 OR allele n=1 Tax=Fusarium circinatum TaxID=48490 RepID=A0A8H5T5P3_FUSCI|nr:heterokaryon incompatibility 6 OR allele [Fusarium circinatum]